MRLSLFDGVNDALDNDTDENCDDVVEMMLTKGICLPV